MAESLPQDVLELIIEELDSESDLKTLTACALTGWQLLLPARRSIFRHTLLRGNTFSTVANHIQAADLECTKYRLEALLQILIHDPCRLPSLRGCPSETPSLASCIRFLDLQLSPTDFLGENGGEIQRLWDEIHGSLPAMLVMLENVERINLHFLPDEECSWRQIDTSITSSLLKFLCSVSLTTISFSNICGLPMEAVLHAPNLQNVYMSDVTAYEEQSALDKTLDQLIQKDNLPVFEPTYDPPALAKCYFEKANSFSTAMMNTPDPLRKLLLRDLQEFCQEDASSPTLTLEFQFLNIVASTLRKLRLQCRLTPRTRLEDISDSFARIDLARLSRLHTLDLSFYQRLAYGSREDLMAAYSLEFLDKSSSTNTIEILKIQFTWRYMMDPDYQEDLVFAQRDWSDLDEVLASPLYANLKEIILNFDVGYHTLVDNEGPEDAAERLRGRLNNMFPRLRSHNSTRNDFKFDVSVQASVAWR